MALDPADLRWIRSYVGTDEPPSDAELEERVLGQVLENTAGTAAQTQRRRLAQAALEILRERRATLLSSPARFSVTGDYSEDNQKNIDALSESIAELETVASGSGGILGTLVLQNPNRIR